MPLDPAALRALADSGYTIIDQAVRTAGVLIVQAPDGSAEAIGDRRSACGEPVHDAPAASAEARTPSAQRPAPKE